MKKKILLKKPNLFVWGFFRLICSTMSRLKFKLKIERNDLKGTKGPCLVIVNHAAAIDFMPICTAIKRRVHFVISKSFYQSLPIKSMLDSCKVIPKNQFQTSITDMRKMKSALDDNKLPLVIYPAGLMTANGINTPMPDATGKSLKWFNQDVYVANLRGSYFANPKWGKGLRKGQIRLQIYKLLDKEQLKEMDGDKLQQLVKEHLSYDEYAIQKQEKVAYKGGDNIDGLQNVLFKCPHCKKEFSFVASNKNVLTCESCGYSVKANKYGLLEQNGEIPLYYDTPSEWYRFIEKTLTEELEKDENFTLSDHAEIRKINHKKHKYMPAGSCEITLDSKKFTIDGTVDGQPFQNHFPTTMYPTLPIKPGKYFEIQDGQEIYRIILDNPKQSIKWIAALEYYSKTQKQK